MGWILAMALDYITGSMAAARAGAWSSGKARDGIWHKCGMIVAVPAAGTDLLLATVLANLPLVELPIQYTGLVCPVVLVWYIVTELGSMAENAAVIGAPVPPWLVRLLALSACVHAFIGELADGVVICHQDGYKRGIASSHGDVYNWFPKHGKTMDDFRADVVRVMNNNTEEDNDMPKYRTLKDVPSCYKPAIHKLMEQGALCGEENPDPNSLKDNVLNLSETYCRVMTTLDRMGKLG